ncbi:MAG TPA: HAMP domain-containing sensor histidine kinase [Solirubrobacteraceae bacterium]|nr:HAMP domain-containing sensor histidine kinase [Solirubrobacteraceae bacterium]
MALRLIRTRLALLVFAVAVAAVGFVYVYVAPSLEDNLEEQKLESLSSDAGEFSDAIVAARDLEIEKLKKVVRRTGDRAGSRVTLLRVDRVSGNLQTAPVADSIGETGDLQFEVATQAARSRRIATGTETSVDGRLAQAALPVMQGKDVERVVVYSASLSDVEANVDLVRDRILVSGAIALLLALGAGLLLASRLARRIKTLEGTARRVARGDMTVRFPVDRDDELGQLAFALDDMQRQLAQLDSARKRFIATASHELRTPIFSLGGFLELLQDEELDPDTRDAFLTQLRGQVDRLGKLATDLLDLSKLEAGSLELRPEPTDLGVLTKAVTSEFEPRLARHHSRIELRLDGGHVEAEVDPERVAQILRILIDNALAHTPPGTNMVVTADRQDGHVKLTVRDFGEGIKRQALERLFEPFYSAGDNQGSGLGLAIARELADRMQGRLSVEALAGRTTFTLELPA